MPSHPAGASAPDRAWSWNPSLYAGSATHYPTGRVAYPPELVAALVRELGLDGTGTLLDVGCGPGSLTLPLAPAFARAIGVDADQGMLDVETYLGPKPAVPGDSPGGEDEIYRAAGFEGFGTVELPSRTVHRSADDIVAAV